MPFRTRGSRYRRLRRCATLIGVTCWATGLSFGCASSRTGAAEVVTGARAEVTEDGLHRMRNAGFKNAWAKPSVDFRAYDKLTGAMLWETVLPASGNATPAIYEVAGRQFVVIAAGGGKSGAPSGGTCVAFALPAEGH